MIAMGFLGFLLGLGFCMLMWEPGFDALPPAQPGPQEPDEDQRRRAELARWNGLPAPNPTRPATRRPSRPPPPPKPPAERMMW